MPLSPASSIYPSTVAFIGLAPVSIPDQATFYIWLGTLLSLILARELDHDWLVVFTS
jgi:hypothetical protein